MTSSRIEASVESGALSSGTLFRRCPGWITAAAFVFQGHAAYAQTAPNPVVSIHAIQGNGSTSPLVGRSVSVQAIVTAVKSNGFFIQMPDAAADGDVDTSEGILVFTGGTPPAAAVVGNEVLVSGTIQEFRPTSDPSSPPVTEIVGATVTVSSTGHPLPAPVTLTAADVQPGGSIEQMERYEGMRVRVDSLTVVAPTQGSINEANATSTSTGVFYAVVTGTDRPFREAGIQTPDAPPPGSPCCIPVFDANPERLRVDSDAQIGAARLEVTAFAIVTGLTGVLDYSFRAYSILPDPGAPVRLTGNVSATPLKAPLARQFTIASFNMERFFNDVAEAGPSVPLLAPAAFRNRLAKASMIIRGVMRMPDILGVQEVENLSTLQAVADRLNADSVAAGEPNPDYRAYLEEGNDVGGIDSGFLVKSSRVAVVGVTQEGKTATYPNPADGSMALLNDRPPLVLQALIASPPGPAFPLTVIVNHLRSLTDVGADPRVRAKRQAQAEYLARIIQTRQAANPDEGVVVLGDFNAFQFSDGYVDSMGAIRGAPAPANTVVLASPDLVEPNLELLEVGDPAQHYSYVFDGSAQTLDHALVTRNLLDRFDSLHYGRVNADFPDSYRNDASRPERLSDHDPVVAYFNLPSASAAVARAHSAAATIGAAGPPPPTVSTALLESVQLSGQAPQGLDVDIETGLVYVSTNGSAVAGCSPGGGVAGTISVVDPGLLKEMHRVENVHGTVWPLVDYARNVVYSANSGEKSLTVHARGTGALLATIPLALNPNSNPNAFSRRLDRLFVTNSHEGVLAFDAATGQRLGSFLLGSPAWGMQVDEASELLYAALPDLSAVGVADALTLEPLALIPVDACSFAVRLDPVRRLGFSTSMSMGRLSIIDLNRVEAALGRTSLDRSR